MQFENQQIKSEVNFDAEGIKIAVDFLVEQCYGLAAKAGWHTDLKTGQPKQHNRAERLMLIVSEVSEAMEGHRKNLQDDKLPQHKMHAVELIDALIRIFDELGSCGYSGGQIMAEKLGFNQVRPDHKIENRVAVGGKAY